MGIANPIPMLPACGPLPSDRIWLVMPITRPLEAISGPPELPWLMAASVCSAPCDRPVGIERADRPVDRRDDPRRDRALLAQGVPDGHHRVAHLDVLGGAQRQRVERLGGHVLRRQHGDVGGLVDAQHARLVGAVQPGRAGEPDPHRACADDHVRVGQDVALAVDHEPRAERLLALGLGQPEAVGGVGDGGGADHHHAGCVAAVDLGRRQAGRGRDQRRRGQRCAALHRAHQCTSLVVEPLSVAATSTPPITPAATSSAACRSHTFTSRVVRRPD